jgi:hypothetical protein
MRWRRASQSASASLQASCKARVLSTCAMVSHRGAFIVALGSLGICDTSSYPSPLVLLSAGNISRVMAINSTRKGYVKKDKQEWCCFRGLMSNARAESRSTAFGRCQEPFIPGRQLEDWLLHRKGPVMQVGRCGWLSTQSGSIDRCYILLRASRCSIVTGNCSQHLDSLVVGRTARLFHASDYCPTRRTALLQSWSDLSKCTRWASHSATEIIS